MRWKSKADHIHSDANQLLESTSNCLAQGIKYMPNYSCNKNITHSSRNETLICVCAFALNYLHSYSNNRPDAFDVSNGSRLVRFITSENGPAQLKHCPHVIYETLLRQTSRGIGTSTYVYLHVVSTEDIPWEVQMDQATGDGRIGTQWLAKAVHP